MLAWATGLVRADETDADGAAITSPRLAQLQRQFTAAQGEDARSNVIAQFWAEVAAQGGSPLVERQANNQSAAVLVTFLWREAADQNTAAQEVRLLAPVRQHNTAVLRTLGNTGLRFYTAVLPPGVKMGYQLAAGPKLPKGERRALREWMRMHASQDVLNPNIWPPPPNGEGVSGTTYSVMRLPGAPPDALPPQRHAPKGSLQHYRLHSEVLGNVRDVAIYLPARQHLATAEPLNLLILFDGQEYVERASAPTVLDQLIESRAVPPTAAVLIGNVNRARELAPNMLFAHFMAQELLPWLHAQVDNVTHDPAQVVVAGSSLGGLASSWVAWQHPELFGNVLSMSGSYWWSPAEAAAASTGWMTQQFATQPRKPIRFYLDVGVLERGADGGPGLLEDNRRLRDVLAQRGYALTYHESPGGHDYLIWQDVLATALPQLLGEMLAS
nr:alpha/beta hydrolase-fold protein [Corticibacter populi]